MKTRILSTKLHRPRVGESLVRLPRLRAMLDERFERPLTLISAPAGYGKSTLVSSWVESRGEPSAWLSLDDSDSDLAVFLSYIAAAVHSLFPDACHETLELLEAHELPPLSALADSLIDELENIEDRFMLVLDDYHSIGNVQVHELIRRILTYPPRSMHLVLVTRRDPSLSLAAMRTRGEVAEVRLRDLQFTQGETAEFVRRATGLTLSQAALDNLQEQLEGWIAGLQLVVQSLKRQKQPESFLLELHGGIREVQDYLMDQVISQQPPDFQQCLLRLSVVDRFSSDFCQGVCDLSDQCTHSGKSMIERVRQSGLSTVPLDETGEWYRYHHLIRDLLQARVKHELGAEAVGQLNARASQWFESNGLVDEAVRHALTADDPNRAAELVERHWQFELDQDRWHTVQRWLSLLPVEIRQRRPRLMLAQSWDLHEKWRVAEILPIIEQIEATLDQGHDVSEESEFLGELGLMKGIVQFWQGKTEESQRCLDDARSRLPRSLRCFWGELEIYNGVVRQRSGDGKAAVEAIEDQIRVDDSSDAMFVSRLTAAQCFIHVLSGELVPASRSAERLLAITKRHGIAYTDAWAAYLRGLCSLQSFDLDAALNHFASASDKRHILHTKCAIDALAGLALTYQLMGKPGDATETMNVLLEFAQATNDREHLDVVYSSQARLALMQNDLASASRWAKSFEQPVHGPEMFIWLETPMVTRARVMVAEGSKQALAEAIQSLDELRQTTQSLNNTCQAIEIMVLRASALSKSGRADESRAALQEALSVTEPGGWIRPFVEPGEPMREMLEKFRKRRPSAWVSEILAAFGATTAATPAEPMQPLVETLTAREEEILELLAKRLRDKEIAEKLFISLETVKSHLKHIYQKLHVGNRRQAVAVGLRSGLISAQ